MSLNLVGLKNPNPKHETSDFLGVQKYGLTTSIPKISARLLNTPMTNHLNNASLLNNLQIFKVGLRKTRFACLLISRTK